MYLIYSITATQQPIHPRLDSARIFWHAFPFRFSFSDLMGAILPPARFILPAVSLFAREV